MCVCVCVCVNGKEQYIISIHSLNPSDLFRKFLHQVLSAVIQGKCCNMAHLKTKYTFSIYICLCTRSEIT